MARKKREQWTPPEEPIPLEYRVVIDRESNSWSTYEVWEINEQCIAPAPGVNPELVDYFEDVEPSAVVGHSLQELRDNIGEQIESLQGAIKELRAMRAALKKPALHLIEGQLYESKQKVLIND